jgi:S1-C subfamily serine protease
LGVLGSDWQEQGVKGVEIVNVLDGSSANVARLQKGEIITNVNGNRIASTDDLASLLSQMEPGTRVTIGYLYKSNLGWMPVSAVAILGRE